jgi:hydrogenase/urease accessory protein HupE
VHADASSRQSTMRSLKWRCGLLWLAVPVLVTPLEAHTVSLTYAEVSVSETQVLWSLKLPIPELDLLLGLDQNYDAKVDEAELAASEPRVRQYVMSKLGVFDGSHAVSGSITAFHSWKDQQGNPFVQIEAVFPAADSAFGKVTLRCDMLRDVAATHKTVAKISSVGRTVEFVFENGRNFEVDASPSLFETGLQFVRMGILHILTGYDHIAFLIGVVLIGGSFKTSLKVVTSFTVAHSITLALAAFRVVQLPGRLVESGIALSIMYIAAENVLFRQFDRRWIVTFFFGLIHGFGFAGALAEVHLSRHLLATALFSFNLGVEAGQLCIVGFLLPILLYLNRQRFHLMFVRSCSAVIFCLGSFWLWQRIWVA